MVLRQGEFIGSLDCGTTSTRFIVFDQYAHIIAQHQSEFEQYHPHAGWHEQDPEEIIECAQKCISKAVDKLEEAGWDKSSIKGIGITNQRETTVCWSRKTGKSLCRCIVWDDARTAGVVRTYEKKLEDEGIEIEADEEESKSIRRPSVGLATSPTSVFNPRSMFAESRTVSGSDKLTMGRVMKGILDLPGLGKSDGAYRRKGKDGLLDLTGIPLSTYFSAIKLRWMLDHHKEVNEAHESDDLMFGTVDSWLVYNLTGGIDGGIHIMDVTNASRTLLVSLRDMSWHSPLLNFFGFKESILPRIVSSAEVYADISEKAGTPLNGVPIAGIVGDQQAALVGNKCLRKGEAKNTYGTGSFVLFNTGYEVVRSEHGLISTVAFQAGPDAKPTFALEGSIAVAGSAIKWLRDKMGLIEKAEDMDRLAGSVDHTGGVYFVTAFGGLLAPYWDREAAGTIIGISSYTTSAHIVRATLDAVCFQTRAVLDVIEQESGVKLDTLKVDGGVTNSDMCMQIQANIGGFKVSRPSMRESTALGSALLAGHALKLFGWDVTRPETLSEVNTADVYTFEPKISPEMRTKIRKEWDKAVERARKWYTIEDEDKEEAEFEKEDGV